jgi:DNA-binding transcriptional regulator YiaG
MSAIAPVVPDLEELRGKAELIEDLVTPPASVDEGGKDEQGVDPVERRQAWHRQVTDAVLDLSNSMPEGVEDYDVRKLLELVVAIRRLLDADPDGHDADGEIELGTMRMADVARRLHRRLVHEQLDDPRIAIKLIFDGLAQVPVSEVAGLLDVSTKTVRAWQRGNAVRQNADRVVLIAQLLTYLRSSMTARGVMMWFEAERDRLGGHTPLQVLDESSAGAYESLIDLARGSRAQLAG